jgi:hypothetical protein
MDPDPTPDPTPFFSDFKDANFFFFIVFSYNLPSGILCSVLKILLKFCVKIYLQAGPGLIPLAIGSGSGMPKNMLIWIGMPNTDFKAAYFRHGIITCCVA